MRVIKISITIICIFIISSCGKKNDSNPAQNSDPGTPVLIIPAQNSVCTTGANQTSGQSTITFQWNAATNADHYTLTIKNLSTNEVKTSVVTSATATIVLGRGAPYSWSVSAASSHSDVTKTSEVWKFYSSGDGITNYAPFPATMNYPLIGTMVSAGTGTVNLTWDDSDPDNDLTGYDVYFGTTTNPSVTGSTSAINKSMTVKIVAGTIYYWKVVAKDVQGNTSDSGISWFSVN